MPFTVAFFSQRRIKKAAIEVGIFQLSWRWRSPSYFMPN
jgi:hypothetical protein